MYEVEAKLIADIVALKKGSTQSDEVRKRFVQLMEEGLHILELDVSISHEKLNDVNASITTVYNMVTHL